MDIWAECVCVCLTPLTATTQTTMMATTTLSAITLQDIILQWILWYHRDFNHFRPERGKTTSLKSKWNRSHWPSAGMNSKFQVVSEIKWPTETIWNEIKNMINVRAWIWNPNKYSRVMDFLWLCQSLLPHYSSGNWVPIKGFNWNRQRSDAVFRYCVCV